MKSAKNVIVEGLGLQEIIKILPTEHDDFDYLIWFKCDWAEYYFKDEVLIEGQ